GGALQQLQHVGAADAAAEDVEPLDAKVVHQVQVVLSVAPPWILDLDGPARAAGVALVQRDRPVLPGEDLHGIERRLAPGVDGGVHAPRRQEQDRKAAALGLVINRKLAAPQMWHRPSSSVDVLRTRGPGISVYQPAGIV